MLVAAATGSTPGDDDARTGVREVGDELVSLEDLRPDRDTKLRVVSARAVRETAAAASTAARPELLVLPQAGEIAPPRIGDEHDVAAVAAVSPVGSAAGHVLLAPEVDRSVTAAARDGDQSCAIVEHRRERYSALAAAPDMRGRGNRRHAASRRAAQAARTERA
jgi:hypothetical protein